MVDGTVEDVIMVDVVVVVEGTIDVVVVVNVVEGTVNVVEVEGTVVIVLKGVVQ